MSEVIDLNPSMVREMYNQGKLSQLLCHAVEAAIHRRFFQDQIGLADFYARVVWDKGHAVVKSTDLGLDNLLVRKIVEMDIKEELASIGYRLDDCPGTYQQAFSPRPYAFSGTMPPPFPTPYQNVGFTLYIPV